MAAIGRIHQWCKNSAQRVVGIGKRVRERGFKIFFIKY